jgi:cytochrome P450
LFPFSIGPRACRGKEMAWMAGKLFMAKVLWTFDVIKVPGQNVDLEETLLHYGFFARPEIKVRFVPVRR